MSATNSFDDLLIRCETVNRQVFEMLDVSFDLDDRGVFALAYFRLIVDVQGSIVQLMRAERFPSAMALVRVTYEPMIRAHWIAQCAPAV